MTHPLKVSAFNELDEEKDTVIECHSKNKARVSCSATIGHCIDAVILRAGVAFSSISTMKPEGWKTASPVAHHEKNKVRTTLELRSSAKFLRAE